MKSSVDTIITIGRDNNNDICINKPKVSSFHAKFIVQSSDKIILQDLNSTNGTYVNGSKISSSEVNFHDSVQFGSYHFDMKLFENEYFEPEDEVEGDPEYQLQTYDYQDQQDSDSKSDEKSLPSLVNVQVFLSIIAIIACGSYVYNNNIFNIKQFFNNNNVVRQAQSTQSGIAQNSNSASYPVTQTVQPPVKNTSPSIPTQNKSAKNVAHTKVNKPNKLNVSTNNLCEVYPLVSQKNGIIQCGETLQGRIDSPGYVETIKFHAQSGEKIGISVSRLNDNNSFYPHFKLVSPSSQTISNNYREWESLGNEEYILPDTGQYSIQIIDGKQRYTGDYAIRLEPVSATFNGLPSPAPEIGCSSTTKGHIALKNATDSYTFSGKCGEKIAIAVTKKSFSALFQPCWQLADPSGTIISRHYKNSFCSGNMDYILPYNGRYTIRVFDGGHNGTGDYHVRLEPITAFLNGEQSCAQKISPGKTLVDSLEEPNATCAYIFDKKKYKASIRVKKKSASASFCPCLTLYNASGEIIERGYKSYICNGKATYTLNSDGPFVIRVWDSNHDSPGKFSILLN